MAWTLVVLTKTLGPSNINSPVDTKSREDTGNDAQQSL